MNATIDRQFRDGLAGNDLADLVPHPRIVLDCGAGDGWFAKSAFQIWPKCVVHSFEPAGRFNLSLQPLNERHFIHRIALGDANRDAVLYATHGPQSNSLLGFLQGGPLEKIHQVVGQEQVELRTLDEIIVDGAEEVDVLKMDVQGAELMVLQGAKRLLEIAKPVIYTEVCFQPLYQDHPLLETVDEYLDFLGYKRLYLYGSPMPDLWGDAIYVPKELDGPIRLNIGAGEIKIPGFTPIDRKLGTEAYPLKYADNSVEEIRCVHMLEHLTFQQVADALSEWNRVLKPGGRLRVSVPDVEKVLELAKEEREDPNSMWRFYLAGGQSDQDDIHKSHFNEYFLRNYLESAGFSRVQRWESPNTDCACLPISLNLEGFKEPDATQPDSVKAKVRAVCGMPRIGWNDAWQSIVDAMNSHGIPIETHQGCFWWQNMQAALSRALKDGIDWVITLDYDSMILPMHVQRLLQVMAERPDIDALAALQMRRGAETPLFSTGKTSQDIDGEPIKVNTAHFGLTAIRVSKLALMPKPWLIDEPDKNGEFNGDHNDADITFWKKWTAAGNTVYIAPDVRIGHLELLVSEFDDEFKPRHRHVGDWWNNHARQGHCMRTTKNI